jgi:hypothetical protein
MSRASLILTRKCQKHQAAAQRMRGVRSIDLDSSGQVRFTEFCAYVRRHFGLLPSGLMWKDWDVIRSLALHIFFTTSSWGTNLSIDVKSLNPFPFTFETFLLVFQRMRSPPMFGGLQWLYCKVLRKRSLGDLTDSEARLEWSLVWLQASATRS